jgi:proteasome lid subunit RPN8/RPN11
MDHPMTSVSEGIRMTTVHWTEMRADIAARAPEEACGFVLGTGDRVEIIIPVTNILHDPFRFRMDPLEELNGFLLAEKLGKEIIAVYHSHPGGIDHPSPSDVAELTFPGIVYLIWFQAAGEWQCKAYLMQNRANPSEVAVIISTNPA